MVFAIFFVLTFGIGGHIANKHYAKQKQEYRDNKQLHCLADQPGSCKFEDKNDK